MKPIEEMYHTVLQKLIIMLLGLLTLSVVLTSCGTQTKQCSAYNGVAVEVIDDSSTD
ncbi:hypothetical protein [Sanyastnella coralliicola]|uniref:hypothetical protein n=1 Tax=Sanyastnella coralliicola TaxID=3069118 RepID=UPI0027B94AEB|nr:hypothetical protein [Longitalea sp. SCSIO 12813]